MIDFPKSTYVHKRFPKEAFYKNLTLTTALREKFITDVERIYVENSLTVETLNLASETDIEEILLLSIELKKQGFDGKIIGAIAKQNTHKLLFLLTFEGQSQLALYHGKLYCSPWMSSEEIELKAVGFSLDEIWEHFVEQVALYEERAKVTRELSIDERLALQDQVVRLEKLVVKTEKALWKEQQPKKRFELYTQLQNYKKKLKGLKNG